MKKLIVSAPGKIHLMGEHAVVFGKPGVLAAISKRCTVTLTPNKKETIEIASRNFGKSTSITEEEVIAKTKAAKAQWNAYQKNPNIALLKSIVKDELDFVIIAIGEAILSYKRKLPSGFAVDVSVDFPIGSGLGSSAAVAVSIVGALCQFLGEQFDKKKINDIAFGVEQRKHGFPAGADNTTCTFGGILWFKRTLSADSEQGSAMKQLGIVIPKAIAENFLILNTGRPKESTGEMVHNVRLLFDAKPELKKEFLDGQGKLTEKLTSSLQNTREEELIGILQEGEKNLERIGVVSAYVKKIIRKIEESGGAGKICGGGGVTRATGILLVYHKNRETVLSIAKQFGLGFDTVHLGAEGVRIDG